MIEKSRLEELIENKQPIYYGKYDVIYPHRWRNGYIIDKNAILRRTFETYKWFYEYEWLFETEDERDWFYKFGNITRTETLSLPSWEELKQKINSNGYGNKTIANFDNYIFEYKKTKTQVVLGINLGCETLFYGVLSLANYTDACELAKRLFLGETE